VAVAASAYRLIVNFCFLLLAQKLQQIKNQHARLQMHIADQKTKPAINWAHPALLPLRNDGRMSPQKQLVGVAASRHRLIVKFFLVGQQLPGKIAMPNKKLCWTAKCMLQTKKYKQQSTTPLLQPSEMQ